MTASIPGFSPVQDANVILVGARALDPAEELLLEESEVNVVRAASVRGAGLRAALTPALEHLSERVPRVHLHVDADVLDVNEARANYFAVDGGLTIAELAETVAMVAERFRIASVTFSAYDPAVDGDGGVVRAVAGCLEAVVR